jgi:hypothetical protein
MQPASQLAGARYTLLYYQGLKHYCRQSRPRHNSMTASDHDPTRIDDIARDLQGAHGTALASLIWSRPGASTGATGPTRPPTTTRAGTTKAAAVDVAASIHSTICSTCPLRSCLKRPKQ